MMKRAFRGVATIAGLIEKHLPGASTRPATRRPSPRTSLYDALGRHEPDHLLLRGARAHAGSGLMDFGRLGEMLARIQGRIDAYAARPFTPSPRPSCSNAAASPRRRRPEGRLIRQAEETSSPRRPYNGL